MPVRRKTAKKPGVDKNMVESTMLGEKKHSSYCCMLPGHRQDFGHTLIKVLGGILLVYLIFYIGTLINNNLQQSKYIGMSPKQERTINVSGYGKITSGNNIAVTTLGYSNTSTNIATAQTNNQKVMNAVLVDLKNLGINKKDIQSNYSIYPQYNYSSTNGRKLSGYQVSHQMTIKIRDLSKIQNVLALAGKYGINQISGLTFTVDDNDSLKSQARVKALLDARAKAQVIANYLGVKLGKAVSYSEHENKKNYYPVMSSVSEGLSSGVRSTSDVSSGSSNVEMNVNVIYEIK